jgi:hypothetical protein
MSQTRGSARRRSEESARRHNNCRTHGSRRSSGVKRKSGRSGRRRNSWHSRRRNGYIARRHGGGGRRQASAGASQANISGGRSLREKRNIRASPIPKCRCLCRQLFWGRRCSYITNEMIISPVIIIIKKIKNVQQVLDRR